MGSSKGRTKPARSGRSGRSEKELIRRGSSQASRIKKAREAEERAARPKHATSPMPSRTNLTKYCRRLIPGYDPWRDSKGYRFDIEAARDAVGFFHKHLTHCKGALAGTPFKLTTRQMAIVGNAFGWKSKADGFRRYRKVLIFVAEKNGKTPLAAGFALKLLVDDDEPGAEVYGLAFHRDQAALVGQWARGMVEADDWLNDRLNVKLHAIEVAKDRNAFYRVVACKEQGLHGVNMHGGVADELHTFDLKRGEAIDTIIKKMKARRQPMFVFITTAGYDRQSYCHEVYQYGKSVIDGKIKDPRFLPVVYEADRKLPWDSVVALKQANPLLGVSIQLPDLLEERDKAKKKPRDRAMYERLNLNRWTDSETIWIPSDEWALCGGVVDRSELARGRCFGGLDIGLAKDLSAFAICYLPLEEDDLFRLLLWYWLPGGKLQERIDSDGVDYWEWSEQGHLELFEGETVTDFDALQAGIVAICEEHKPEHVAYDPYSAKMLAGKLEHDDGLPMLVHRQGYKSMAAPTAEFERLAATARLRHDDNPMLEWNLRNTAIRVDPAGNKKPDKERSTGRIDGIVASIMAVGLAMDNAKDTQRPRYAERGAIVV